MIRIDEQLFAHRGLHLPDGPPENSLESFVAAEQNGYGIELDVRVTCDGELVVIHDAEMSSVDGFGILVESTTFARLSDFGFEQFATQIPTLGSVLDALESTTPLLVEVKPSPRQRECTAKVVDAVRNRTHSTAVQSFHPAVVRQAKRSLPELKVGQLGGIAPEVAAELPIAQKAFLMTLVTNPWAQPDFLSLEKSYLETLPARFWRRNMMCPVLAWTIRGQEDFERVRGLNVGYIFEGFLPALEGSR